MNDPGFTEIARAIHGLSGLALSPDKGYLLRNRLAPIMQQRGLASLSEVARQLPTAEGPRLLRELAEATTTNETSFFRDVLPLRQIAEVVVPALDAARTPGVPLRIWSAACSSGQEAYSLAIALAEAGCTRRLEIFGTDLSSAMVARAREGLFSRFEVDRGLAAAQRDRWFREEAGGWRVAEPLRRQCRFEVVNLLGDLRGLGRFDVVLLRNVLIYFDLPTREKVVTGCVAQLAPDGAICLGATETLLGLTVPLAPHPSLRGVWRRA
ncbi:protein-glutamate O-methyltransferase CheR [Roseomonas frigidaquae]|uniref:protein-glutamate O-methyltransferase n=1 Tax=Falsiroseomonas frigidaquae TaxID=487318 RepID=A0ABX1ESL3_9PROT|nr:protein-glutamate O-methyltransferase CheR [Falsiroseomonas frigidaquae]NKE43298.1 protein-glutamate O-methyltransferase CheR [Falsiroseomonas frigidaquae]